VCREHSRQKDLDVQSHNGTEALRTEAKVWDNVCGNRPEAYWQNLDKEKILKSFFCC
jgi:hypothetical protein